MQLLDHQQIASKVTRLAMEILERNTEEDELYVIGINDRGMELARRLVDGLQTISKSPLHLRQLRINPRTPLSPGFLSEARRRSWRRVPARPEQTLRP